MRRNHQDNQDEPFIAERLPQRLHPRRTERAEEEVSYGHHEVGEHQRAAEAEAVGESAAENREKPHDEAESASEPASEFVGEVQLLVEVNREDGGGAVVGDALEDFREVGDPEGGLEAFANFLQALGKAQKVLLDATRSTLTSMRRGQLRARPAAIVSESFGATCGFSSTILARADFLRMWRIAGRQVTRAIIAPLRSACLMIGRREGSSESGIQRD